MAASIKVGVDVSDNGTVSQLQTKLKGLNRELASLKNAMKQTGSGSAGSNIPGKQENIEYRNARGVAGTGGGGSRDFAKQAQGLGGLVHLYATFAANIFAVSAAFMALDKAAQFEQMIQGAKALEASTGASLRSIADQMKNVTDGALSMQESMRLTALGSAAGLSQKKILELTKGAKGASLALGRDMGDSIDRVIRGVAKLEPELLDELGVVTRAQEAYKKYAQSIGVSTDALTSYQKTVAYSNAVSTELLTKFGAIADKVPANPYAKFLGQLKDVGTELLTLVNNVITPVITTLSNNIELMFAGVLLLVKNLTLRAVPEIAKLFTVSPAVITARRAQGEAIIAEMKAASLAEISLAQEKQQALIETEQNGMVARANLHRKEIAQNKARAFADPSSPTAMAVNRLSEGTQIDLTSRQLAALKGNVTRATTDLNKALGSGTASAEQIANLTARQTAAVKILSSSLGIQQEIRTTDLKIADIKLAMSNTESDILAKQKLQTTNSQAQIDLAKNHLAVLKMERNQLIENANYTDPTGRSGAAVAAAQDAKIREARIALLATNTKNVKQGPVPSMGPNNVAIPSLAGMENTLNSAGKRALAIGSAMDIASIAVSGLGKAMGRLLSFLGGPWVIGAMVAFEVLSFAADKFGWLNKQSDAFNKSIEEGAKVLEVAVSSYGSYNDAVIKSVYSVDALIKSNNVRANTMEQTSAAIDNEITSYNKLVAAATWYSKVLDSFGKSNFDKLKENLGKTLNAAAAQNSGADKEEITKLAKLLSGVSSGDLVTLNSIRERFSSISALVVDKAKNEVSRIQDLQKAYLDAATAAENFNKKELIKNSNLQIIDSTFTKLNQTLESIQSTSDEKLQALANLPEELAKLDTELLAMHKAAIEELAGRKEAADREAKSQAEIVQKMEQYSLTKEQLIKLESSSAQQQLDNLDAERDKQSAWQLDSFNKKHKNEITFLEEQIALQKTADEERRNKDAEANKYWSDLEKTKAVEVGQSMADAFFEKLKNLFSGKGFFTDEIVAAKTANLAGASATANSLLGLPSGTNNMLRNIGPAKEKPFTLDSLNPIVNDSLRIDPLRAVQSPTDKTLAASKRAQATSAARDKKDNNSGNALEKEKLAMDLKVLQATTAEQEKLNQLESLRTGFLSKSSIELQQQNKVKELVKAQELEELDIQQKYNKSAKDTGLTEKQRISLKESALASSKKELETKLRGLGIDTDTIKMAEKSKEFAVTRALELEKEAIAAAQVLSIGKAKNTLSEYDIVLLEDKAKLASLQTAVEKAAVEASTNVLDKNKQLTLQKAQQAFINEEDLQTAKAHLDIVRKELKELSIGTEILSLKADINARMYPDSARDILLTQLKYEKESLQLSKEFETSTDKNVEGAKELLFLKQKKLALDKLDADLELKKKGFGKLSGKEQMGVLFDEADKRAREFANSLKDGITAAFDSVYASMDTAIDTFTERLFTGQKLGFKEIIQAFDAQVAAESRKYIADQLKSVARKTIAGILNIDGLKTAEEKAQELAQQSVDYLERITNAVEGNGQTTSKDKTKELTDGLGNIVKSFKTDAPGMEGQVAFSELSLAEKWGSNSGFNMNSAADNAENAASAAEYFKTANIDAIEEVGGTFQDMLSSAGNGLDSVFGNSGIFGKLLSGMGSGLDSVLGGIGSILNNLMSNISGGSSGGGIGGLISQGVNWVSSFFANGGIMSEYGPLKLNKYASGGIANSPQMAVFGEGSKPEAYVPLPDGRNIPVVMQHKGDTTTNNTQAVTPQVINVTNNFTVQGNPSRESQEQIATRVGQSINRALKRNG
jgi:hypothetical protein